MQTHKLTVQYQQDTQTAINCTIPAIYTRRNYLYNSRKLHRKQLTVQYLQGTKTEINFTISGSHIDNN